MTNGLLYWKCGGGYLLEKYCTSYTWMVYKNPFEQLAKKNKKIEHKITEGT